MAIVGIGFAAAATGILSGGFPRSGYGAESSQIGSTLATRTPQPSATQAGSAPPAQAARPAPSPSAAAPAGAPLPTTATSSSAPSPAQTSSPATAQLPAAKVVPDRYIHVIASTGEDGAMHFHPSKLDVTANQLIEVTLENKEKTDSGINHNWVLIKPRSQHAVAALGKDAGVEQSGVVYSPSIMAATPTAAPGQTTVVDFQAPNTPGSYPFISLEGEQWKQMKGVLIVHRVKDP